MISKSFHARQQHEELSFKKQNKTLLNLPRKNLSQTQATDEDEDYNDSVNSHDESQDQMQESNAPTARDALLLKCRDAIESLHLEIEEERAEKQRLADELSELQRFTNDLQLQDQEKTFSLQKLTEDGIQLQNDLMVITKEKERLQYERDDYER